MALAALSLLGGLRPELALLLGAGFALISGGVFLDHINKGVKRLLALSIVGLGAGMNLMQVMQAGLHGLVYSALSIGFALAVGLALGRLLKVERALSWLISGGTAICGGSAIAALAPVLHAKGHQTSVALGVVFMLNALGLVVFPALGHMLGLSQVEFGVWSAMAIHDTSSVVGAGMAYGPEALEVATTTKLVRALWIVPLVLAVQAVYHRTDPAAEGAPTPPRKYPWFIAGFVAMAALVSFIPALQEAGAHIAALSRRALVLTLFLIGASLTPSALKNVGFAPFLQGAVLWAAASLFALAVVKIL